MRILLIGSGYLGLALLDGLLALQQRNPNYRLVGVFPWSYSQKGKTLKDDGETALLQSLRRHHITPLSCVGANHYDFTAILEKLKPDVLLVGCWGEILKPHLLNRADLKVINCHPSKLPAHRGANPYASVILQNETETGVTFHWVNEGIDDGPILHQKTLPLSDLMTGGDVRAQCCGLAESMVEEALQLTEGKTATDFPPQPEAGKSYYPQITLADGAIDWETAPSNLLKHLRGLKPWLSSYAWLVGGPRNWLTIFHELTPVPTTPQTNPPVAAGNILARRGHVLWIQSSDPSQCFTCRDYQFYFLWGFLPKPLSRLLSRVLIPPGTQFVKPA